MDIIEEVVDKLHVRGVVKVHDRQLWMPFYIDFKKGFVEIHSSSSFDNRQKSMAVKHLMLKYKIKGYRIKFIQR